MHEKTQRLHENTIHVISISPPVGRVTLCFTDVQSSTKLWEADPLGMMKSIITHNILLRQSLEDHKGYEVLQ